MTLTRSGVQLTPLVPACLLVISVVFSATLFGALLTQLLFPSMERSSGAFLNASAQVVELTLSYGPIWVFLLLWLSFFERRPFRTIGLQKRGAFRKLLRGAFIGLLMMSAVTGILSALGHVRVESGDPQLPISATVLGIAFVAIGWAVQGSAEEALTRGWLLQVAGARFGPPAGILLSSLAFSLLHVFSSGITLLALVNVFLSGIFFALYALYEGGIWGVCALHATLNWAEVNIFGFHQYQSGTPGGELLNLELDGPQSITGAGATANITGGFPFTLIFVLGILAIALLASYRSTRSRGKTSNTE